MKFFIDDTHIPVVKCRKPKMTSGIRATWDHGFISIDEARIKAFLDTTWGKYVYFQLDGQWYKVRMYNESFSNHAHYDIDPFAASPVKIKTFKNKVYATKNNSHQTSGA